MDRWRHYTTLARARYRHHVLGKSETDPRVLLMDAARAVYVPVPKAANSSVKLALAPVLGVDPATITEVQKDPRLPMVRFSEIADRLTPDWFVFTVTRDPWTRSYSAWRDKVIRQEARLRALHAMGIQPGDDFETFLRVLSRWPRKMLNDHFIPQADLLEDPMAHGPVEIVKSEDLPKIWPQIADRIAANGVPRPAPIGVANQSGPRTRPDLSPAEQALIKALYADDFTTFGYSAEGSGDAEA
ncbi:MAG: sulfotransferase family 2 domain-containing protein [Qingshengfaniella sp.]